MQYRFCQQVLASNIPFPELPPTTMAQPAFTFTLGSANDSKQPPQWFHHWCFPDQTLWSSFAKLDDGYLIRFHHLADYRIANNGREIYCYPRDNTPLDTLRHLLLDQVIPIVMSQQGKLILHAGAVAFPHGAVAFLGATGLGKSTLSASLAAQGFSLLTDDCLLLEENNGQWMGISSYPGLRLWSDSLSALFVTEPPLATVAHYTTKKRLIGHSGEFHYRQDPLPIKRFYFLAQPDSVEQRQVEITPLTERAACIELLKHSFHLDITDRSLLKQEFERLGRISALGLCYRLAYPREHAYLPAVHAAILADVQRL